MESIFDRLEATTLFAFIGCIGFFTAFFLLFYPLFEKKSSLIQLNRPGQPILIGELRMANTPVNLNAKKGAKEGAAPQAILGENTWRGFSVEPGAIPIAVLLQWVSALALPTANALLNKPLG
jgi:hypothetical protein